MKKQGFVITVGKKQKEFFSTIGSYQRPCWTSLKEATVYYSADQAYAAAKQLWKTGHFAAKVVSLNEVDVVHSLDNQEDCELTVATSPENEKTVVPNSSENDCPVCNTQHTEDEEYEAVHFEDETEHTSHLHQFQKGQTVVYNGARYVIVNASPDSTLITLAPDGMEANPRSITKVDARQIQLVREAFTMPKKPHGNPETPKNTNEIPSLDEPYKSKEIEFEHPAYKADRPDTDLTTATAWEHEEIVKVPAKVKSALKATIEEFKKCADLNYARDDTRASFCMTVHDALQMLMDDLDEGTVKGIKQAQIHMTSFMNPIVSNIPDVVVNFIARGGRKLSLKDFFEVTKERRVK